MKIRRFVISFFALALAVLFVLIVEPSSGASNALHKARLLGFSEVPAVSTTGSGDLRARIDEGSQTIDYRLTYQDLEGATTTAAHIHLGQESVNGGVIAFLCGGGGKPACTPTSGDISGTIAVSDILGPAGQGIAAGEFDEVVRA